MNDLEIHKDTQWLEINSQRFVAKKIKLQKQTKLKNQLPSYFTVQGNPEKTQREKAFTWQWRNNKEKGRLKENGGQMKRR